MNAFAPAPAAPDPDCAALAAIAERAGAEALLAEAIARRFRGRIAVASSFGVEAAPLLHMIAAIEPALPVLFVDTGKLFPETLAYRDRLVAVLGLRDVRTVAPAAGPLQRRDPAGELWRRDADACCGLRKVAPLAQALAGFAAWISGRKRFHGDARRDLPPVERGDGRIKLYPLADWSAARLRDYARRHGLPPHPLAARGYGSAGCAPCTEPTRPGEGPRAGRWRGSAKTECGIHFDLGRGMAAACGRGAPAEA